MESKQNRQIDSNIIRQVILLALVFGLGYLIFREMSFMMSAFLGAVALYMLMRKPMFKMVYSWKIKRWIAALLLMLISLGVIVFPFALIINVLISRLVPIIQDTAMLSKNIHKIDAFVHKQLHFDLLSTSNIDKLPGIATNIGTSVVGSTLSLMLNVVLMYFILWFMLVKSSEMENAIRKGLPLKNTNVNRLLHEIKGMVVSNAVGIPVLAVFQGLLATLGYFIFGVDEPILWGIVTGIASVIPIVGTALIWIPVALLEFSQGNTTNGWWILIWGAVIVASMDNVLRFILQKYMADVHPLITVLGVIVGLNLFGFLGLIFGPLLFSLFLLLFRIYKDEFISPPTVNPG